MNNEIVEAIRKYLENLPIGARGSEIEFVIDVPQGTWRVKVSAERRS